MGSGNLPIIALERTFPDLKKRRVKLHQVTPSEKLPSDPSSPLLQVWGIIHFETPTISLTWRDMRAYSTPCPDFAEAFVWPDGVTLGFERIKKCVTRQAEVKDDLAQLVATVKPDLVYAQHGFVPLDAILENTPQVVRVGLLGWAQLSKVRTGLIRG